MPTVPLISIISIAAYFLLLLLVSRLTGKRSDNDAFFRGNRRSPWYLVAFGMIGASVSGVSFVSVPGYVGVTQMTYLQMCLGFVVGYVAVAYLLLPVYYRRRLTTIYSFLGERFGAMGRKTGASFFILSKMARACASFYLACAVLGQFVFQPLGLYFWLAIPLMLLLVWLYTRRGGIRTLVYTDTVQTLCMLAALVAIIWIIARSMGLDLRGLCHTVTESPMSRVFVLDDWQGKQAFWKQFVSGIFIVIVMTGLDQDMMQKNLTCKDLRSAQKDMCSYGVCFVPVNLLFLILGVLLYIYAGAHGIAVPKDTDRLLPQLVYADCFGAAVTVLFVLGMTAAAFSSVDSALTALTTTVCIDLLGLEDKRRADSPDALRIRRRTHGAVVVAFVIFTILFGRFNGTSLIDAVYIMASYTYGPLLGLFAFALLCKGKPRRAWIPVICVLAPVACYGLSVVVPRFTGYTFGYELLLLNGLLTFGGLHIASLRNTEN